MRKAYRNYYRFTKPPQALLQARMDNIAIVPASMLPFTKTLQQVLSTLPKGAVFLCHAEENTRQRKLLERVEEAFREQGHTVRSMSGTHLRRDTVIPQWFQASKAAAASDGHAVHC